MFYSVDAIAFEPKSDAAYPPAGGSPRTFSRLIGVGAPRDINFNPLAE